MPPHSKATKAPANAGDLDRDLTFQPTINPNPNVLTPAQVEHFNKHGFVAPFRVFDGAGVEKNRAYFDGLLAHGSAPNTSNRRRGGLTIRYCPPTVRTLAGWNKNSIICRGSDPAGHWADIPRPSGEDVR